MEREGRAERMGEDHDNMAQAKYDQNIIHKCKHTLIKHMLMRRVDRRKGEVGRERKTEESFCCWN